MQKIAGMAEHISLVGDGVDESGRFDASRLCMDQLFCLFLLELRQAMASQPKDEDYDDGLAFDINDLMQKSSAASGDVHALSPAMETCYKQAKARFRQSGISPVRSQ